MNLCWITASFPCSTLGMVLWNVAWEEEDYTYWEIIWNYRPGFGIILSKNGWVVESEDEINYQEVGWEGGREREVWWLFSCMLSSAFTVYSSSITCGPKAQRDNECESG